MSLSTLRLRCTKNSDSMTDSINVWSISVAYNPDPPSGTVLRQWDKTHSCFGSRLTSTSDSVLCLMRIAHARFLSDTTHCPIVTSKSVCRTTVSDGGSGAFTEEILATGNSANLTHAGPGAKTHSLVPEDTLRWRRCSLYSGRISARFVRSLPARRSTDFRHKVCPAGHGFKDRVLHVQRIVS